MDKTFWIGDDGDNKSVKIGKKIYGRGDSFPAVLVAPELLKEWADKGLISVGAKSAPVVIQDTETVKARDAEIRVLKADLDRLPGLQREVTELRDALEKAKSGKKAARVKELEENAIAQNERISTLEKIGQERSETIEDLRTTASQNESAIDNLELDNQEKAALIDKLNNDIEALTKPDDEVETDDDSGAGPGGA